MPTLPAEHAPAADARPTDPLSPDTLTCWPRPERHPDDAYASVNFRTDGQTHAWQTADGVYRLREKGSTDSLLFPSDFHVFTPDGLRHVRSFAAIRRLIDQSFLHQPNSAAGRDALTAARQSLHARPDLLALIRSCADSVPDLPDVRRVQNPDERFAALHSELHLSACDLLRSLIAGSVAALGQPLGYSDLTALMTPFLRPDARMPDARMT